VNAPTLRNAYYTNTIKASLVRIKVGERIMGTPEDVAAEKYFTPPENPLVLAKEILDFAYHGDYSNGNEAFGYDEGRVRGRECLDAFQKRIDDTALVLDAIDLAKEILAFAEMADYSNGNTPPDGAPGQGTDEGSVRASECLQDFQRRIDELAVTLPETDLGAICSREKQKKSIVDIDYIASQIDRDDFKRNFTLAYIALQERLVQIHNEDDQLEHVRENKKYEAYESFVNTVEGNLHRSLVFEPMFYDDGSLMCISVVLNSTPHRHLLELDGKVKIVQKSLGSVGEKEEISTKNISSTEL